MISFPFLFFFSLSALMGEDRKVLEAFRSCQHYV